MLLLYSTLLSKLLSMSSIMLRRILGNWSAAKILHGHSASTKTLLLSNSFPFAMVDGAEWSPIRRIARVGGGIPHGKERDKAHGGRFKRETWIESVECMKGEGRWDAVRHDFVRVRKGPLSVGEYEKIHQDPPCASLRRHGWGSAVKGTHPSKEWTIPLLFLKGTVSGPTEARMSAKSVWGLAFLASRENRFQKRRRQPPNSAGNFPATCVELKIRLAVLQDMFLL